MPAETVIEEGRRGRRRRATGRKAAFGLGRRLLTLREGSVIVITLLVAAYFAATTDAFLTWRQLQDAAAVLRPVRDPRGGRGVPDDQRGDRPLDRRGLPVRAVHVPRVPRGRAAAAGGARAGDGDVPPRRPGERAPDDVPAHQLVHHHARDAARAHRPHADHLRRAARVHARHGRDRRAVHVREGLRRRHVLGADLGARDRDRAAARAQLLALGDLHGRGRAATGSAPPRPASGSGS